MNQVALLTPVFVLILWTFIISLIMAYGRVRYTRNPQDAAHTKNLRGMLPDWVEKGERHPACQNCPVFANREDPYEGCP